MKTLFVNLFLLIHISIYSQNVDSSDFFELRNDTVIFYLDYKGDITINSRASYYRRAILDKQKFTYKGTVRDYYINKQIAYQCSYDNDQLFGEVKCFYANGQLKYKGYYKNSLKDSVWTYYYDNGNMEKTIIFNADTPYLKEFYKKNGKNMITNGNGKYTTSIISGYKQTDEYRISGHIRNGKMDGKWAWSSNKIGNSYAKEYFDNGKFIKGVSNGLVYNENQVISLLGFDLFEDIDIFKIIAIPNIKRTMFLFSQLLKYKESNNLNETLTPDIENFIANFNSKNSILNYWCFIQFAITANNEIENIKVYSNNDLVSNNVQKFISTLSSFESFRPNDKPVSCDIYICLFSDNGKIIIPKYDLNTGFDIMDLIPNK